MHVSEISYTTTHVDIPYGGIYNHGMNNSANKTALLATLHCLTGCAIGERLGMVISTALHWSALPSIALAVTLAFLFGYAFSMIPLLRGGLKFKQAVSLALAADTISITVMEVVDNGFLLLYPGAIHAALDTPLFWYSMALALIAAFIAAFPVNKYLIAKGLGHAVVHEYHQRHDHNHHH